MKTAVALALLAGLLLLVIGQHSSARRQAAADAASISSLREQVAGLEQENRSLKQTLQKQAAIRAAQSTGAALALRYRNNPPASAAKR